MSEKIFAHRNNERIEITGAELEAFLADSAQLQATVVARQAEQDAMAAAKESAINKLSVLGLSENEIKALVGA